MDEQEKKEVVLAKAKRYADNFTSTLPPSFVQKHQYLLQSLQSATVDNVFFEEKKAYIREIRLTLSMDIKFTKGTTDYYVHPKGGTTVYVTDSIELCKTFKDFYYSPTIASQATYPPVDKLRTLGNYAGEEAARTSVTGTLRNVTSIVSSCSAKAGVECEYLKGSINGHAFMYAREGLAMTEVIDRKVINIDDKFVSSISVLDKGGCYVATCVYGNYNAPEVWTLRRYRDYVLDTTPSGRAFIKLYYATSPTIVKWFGHTKWFKAMWKRVLDRKVKDLRSRGFDDSPYQDKYLYI